MASMTASRNRANVAYVVLGGRASGFPVWGAISTCFVCYVEILCLNDEIWQHKYTWKYFLYIPMLMVMVMLMHGR